ncbi:MAG TPA: YhcH/YjgK/YiaL family protein [Longimicrobium sp.]
MIHFPLRHADRYAALLPGMDAAIEWLRAFGPALPDGRHPVDGERVFALVSSYATGPSTEKRFEAHRLHADVQWIASGAERILYLPAEGLAVTEPYSDEADVLFFEEPRVSSSLLMSAGHAAVFFPEDAHKPGCMAGARHDVRKVVVKIRL